MRSNNKGFTIIELVIVIAVIAILAGVMIPTFSSVTKRAKDSAALQEAEAAQSILLTLEDGQLNAPVVEDYVGHTKTTTIYYFILNRGEDDVRWYELKDGELTTVDAPTAKTPDTQDDKVYAISQKKAEEVLNLFYPEIADDDPEKATKEAKNYTAVLNEDLADVVIWKLVMVEPFN